MQSKCLLLVALLMTAGIVAPVPDPTPDPTPEPSTEPTAIPTDVPTDVPTAVPTVDPTDVPTGEPTSAPTGVPTSEPTAIPTVVPTSTPTGEPTLAPTPIPTFAPTPIPTVKPTPVPTFVPTRVPPADDRAWVLLFISSIVCLGVNDPATDFDASYGSVELCEWDFITCDDLANVVTIILQYRGCTGTLDLRNLPPLLQKLQMDNNVLTGTVDLTVLPATVTQVTLDHNQFTGTPDLTQLPPGIFLLNLDNNQFSGALDLSRLPDTFIRGPGSIRGLTLQNNYFCGSSVVNGTSPACGMLRPSTNCTCVGSSWTCTACSTPHPVTPAPLTCLPTYPDFPTYTNITDPICQDFWNTCTAMYDEFKALVAALNCQCDSCPTSPSTYTVRSRYVAVRQACDQFMQYYCGATYPTLLPTPVPTPSP